MCSRRLLVRWGFTTGGYLADFLGKVRMMITSSIISSVALLIAFMVNKPLIVIGMVLVQLRIV